MRARLVVLVGALISALLLSAACGGGVTSGLPTAPSSAAATATGPAAAPVAPVQPFPSLTGRWRTAGTRIAYRNLETGIIPDSYSCEGSLTIHSQDGRVFSGTLNTTGHGWNSDRFCTGSGTLTGNILSNDGSSATARLDGSISANQCTFVQRAGEFNGIASEVEIRLQKNDIMRCPVNLDGGPGMPIVQFERTVTLAFARWSTDKIVEWLTHLDTRISPAPQPHPWKSSVFAGPCFARQQGKHMADKTPCPRCRKTGLVRLETIIKGGRSLRHYYCGACAHEWEISEWGGAPPKNDDRSIGRPDRSRA